MGTQQLLLVVLAIIIVGVAAQIGVHVAAATHQSLERDAIVRQMGLLLGDAMQYKSRPRTLGGGGGTFEGFNPLPQTVHSEHFDISFSASKELIIFEGYGSVPGWDGRTPVQVIGQYTDPNTWTLTNVN